MSHCLPCSLTPRGLLLPLTGPEVAVPQEHMQSSSSFSTPHSRNTIRDSALFGMEWGWEVGDLQPGLQMSDVRYTSQSLLTTVSGQSHVLKTLELVLCPFLDPYLLLHLQRFY